MAINIKEYRDRYAYDISKNVISKGELYDNEVLSQSIELILCTMYGERLFNPSFGSTLPSYIFDFINEKTGEKLLDEAIAAVHKWENRVTIISQRATLEILPDDHTIILTLPYIINQTGVTSIFKKKLIF